ncbi:MAG: KH domain-containing protein [Clostridia bacterium]|nr:KH domain-containing protein [Clostridia bacterium]
MKELVEHIAKALVNNPDAAQVSETRTDEGWDLLLQVAPEDIGKIIGKQGRIAKAMRAVLKAAAAKDGLKVNLEIK